MRATLVHQKLYQSIAKPHSQLVADRANLVHPVVGLQPWRLPSRPARQRLRCVPCCTCDTKSIELVIFQLEICADIRDQGPCICKSVMVLQVREEPSQHPVSVDYLDYASVCPNVLNKTS